MHRASYVAEKLESSRATINMFHNNVSLTVSQDEATRVEDEAKRRLLFSGKLSLVVDLDQTIIHATVDPTVADWQKDENNPNHEAVKDVRSFLLKDDGPGNRGCWYYVKLRPGLEHFLENVSKLYELHIYTMGTRQYAKHIADIIDPDHKVFGDRILSRDESGSMTAKNLQRLFPVDTKMVVIIDDRGDVWKWSPNLIKVTPYDFFVGIGDINSSFLPKKPELRPSPKVTITTAPDPGEDLAGGAAGKEAKTSTNGVRHEDGEHETLSASESLIDTDSSPLDQLVAMGGADDPASRSTQSSQQDEALAAQLEERPLLQKQRKLEADEAVAAAETALKEEGDDSKSVSEKSSDSDKPKHNLLQDRDRELYQLEHSLRMVHSAFFTAHKQLLAEAQGGRLGQLRGAQKRKLASDASDLDLVPDIKNIMPAVKSKVLGKTVIVLSGMVPLGMDVASTDIALQSISFGARIEEEVTKQTTHLVAARNRTQKVRTAMRQGKGRIKVVSPDWLHDCTSSWSKVDEEPYLLDVEESRHGAVDEDDDLWSESESLAEDESEDTDTDSLNTSNGKPPKLKLTTKPPRSVADDESEVEAGSVPDYDYDEKSPVGGTNEDWSAMNDELKDFLGSEAEESEDDNASITSERSAASTRLSVRGKKRARDESESGGESDGEKKTRKKQTTGTTLTQNTLADDQDQVVDEGEEEPKEGDGWSDFGDEDFEAEWEKANSDGQEEISPA